MTQHDDRPRRPRRMDGIGRARDVAATASVASLNPRQRIEPDMMGVLVATGQQRPSLRRTLAFRSWNAFQVWRRTGRLNGMVMPRQRPRQGMLRRLEGRLFDIDHRHNVTLRWRHPGTWLLVTVLAPLGLIAIPISRVYLWRLQRHRRAGAPTADQGVSPNGRS